MRTAILLAAAALLLAGTAQAEMVYVEIQGEVEWNSISFGSFADVSFGDPVTIGFTVDSENYVDSPNYPVRGYVIIHETFSVTIGSVTEGLADPFPSGLTPYFVLRNNDPAVDGFFLSTIVDWPVGVPLDEPAQIDPYFKQVFEVGYTGDTLESLDIVEAAGDYAYDGLTNYYFGILDGPFDAMGMGFYGFSITVSTPVEDVSWGRVKALYR